MVSEIPQFLNFCNLAWKCLFTPLLGEFFWGTFPHISPFIALTPKGPSFGRTTSFEPLSVNIGCAVRDRRWSENKRTVQDRTRKKSQKGYISPIWGEAPIEAINIKNCLVCDLLGIITCAKFQNEIFRDYDYTGVEFSIFLLIFERPLQQRSVTVISLSLFCNTGIH